MKREITTPVLLEVNIGGEESKTGMAPAELEETACAIAANAGHSGLRSHGDTAHL